MKSGRTVSCYCYFLKEQRKTNISVKMSWKSDAQWTKLRPFSYFQVWYFDWYQTSAMLEIFFIVLSQRMMQLSYKKLKKLFRPTDPLPKWGWNRKQDLVLSLTHCRSITSSNNLIWATSWENLFMPYANNKGADQPAHPRSLISAFVVRCLDSMISILAKSKRL